MVCLERLDAEDEAIIKEMIQKHIEYTDSDVGRRVLKEWDSLNEKIIKVMPMDYKRVLEALKQVEATGMSGDEAVMAAFEANVQAKARVAGN